MINLTDTQKDILNSSGHVLVEGGPGSGKTTISILKAGLIVQEHLKRCQRVLFLSFARATVSRILEALSETNEISSDIKRQIEVDTYHAFFWRLIRSHGYLLGLPRRLEILTPPNEAVVLSGIRNEYKPVNKLSSHERAEKEQREDSERLRFAMEEGLVCFDLFTNFAGQLLHDSNKIRLLVANAYPTIILDEFQDTADDQWHVIRALGRGSDLLALADPEQRIFDFIGAHPKRLQHFENEFDISKFDLKDENHRSKGTDIVQFADDVLKGSLSRHSYEGIYVDQFAPNKNQAFMKLVVKTLQARKRLLENGPEDWSLAILVPTKRMVRIVSDTFRNPTGSLRRIEHHAMVDVVAAVLAAEVIAYALQGQNGRFDMDVFILLVCNYFRGKGGETPANKNLNEASHIQTAYETAQERRQAGKEPAKNSLFLPIEAACAALKDEPLTGIPDRDWVMVRNSFANCDCKRLRGIATEVRNVRLLDRGVQLREAMSQDWRDNAHYPNALEIVRQAFLREHFSTTTKVETGIVVTNMHKAKGKQFDEVIIFEGWPRNQNSNPDRIVRGNLRKNIDEQTRQNLKVSITRAKKRTTLLTPRGDPCILLRMLSN